MDLDILKEFKLKTDLLAKDEMLEIVFDSTRSSFLQQSYSVSWLELYSAMVICEDLNT